MASGIRSAGNPCLVERPWKCESNSAHLSILAQLTPDLVLVFYRKHQPTDYGGVGMLDQQERFLFPLEKH